MSADTLAPPQPPRCLTRSYLSRGIKGGTIIAEDVFDLEEHRKRLLDPDSYRPPFCRNCSFHKSHAHCFRERILRPADRSQAPVVVLIRLFACAHCGAIFRILPAFIARHLWRAWKTVESVASGREKAPKTTTSRWLCRLRSDATQLVQVFAANIRGVVTEALVRWPPSTRAHFVDVIKAFLRARSSPFARTAAWIHRLAPGVRLA